MDPKLKNVLVSVAVVLFTAVYAVGIFLLWDVFNVEGQLDKLLDTDIYGTEYNPLSSTNVTVNIYGKDVTDAEAELLKQYFRFSFAGMGAMHAENLSRMYTVQTVYELYDALAFEYEAYLLGKCPLDLSFDDCSVSVNVKRRHIVPKNNKIELDALISAQLHYTNLGKICHIREENHSFTLSETGRNPLILEHKTDRPARKAADKGLDKVLSENGFTRSDLNYTFLPGYISQALDMLKEEADGFTLYTTKEPSFPEAEFEYDRDTAANYAEYGFDGSGAFAEYEINDANYISRCIFEGGIPMDSQGERYGQWKWYDGEVNSERKKTGCSETWFDMDAFYAYVTGNEGFGLAGCEVSNGDGKIGDVVQLIRGGKAYSEFMITGIMADGSGKAVDYLLSNDTYSSVSLRSLGTSEIRVLHIVGYNTANI